MKKVMLCFFLAASTPSLALVEYGDPAPSPSSRWAKKKAPAKVQSKGQVKRRSRFPLSKWRANFSLGMETVQSESRRDFWIFNSFLQTPWDIFVSGRFRRAGGEGAHRGNAGLLLGFNWLRFGGGSNRVGVDVFGGAGFGQKGSRFATSRTDTIFGLKTYKSFHRLSLEMGFQHHFTGEPQAGELSIGDIQTFFLELGWQAGPDISVALEGGAVRVSPQEGGLNHKMNWGYLSPMLKLRFSSLVGLDIKADFRTTQTTSPHARQARLWDFAAACGNSLQANMLLTLF